MPRNRAVAISAIAICAALYAAAIAVTAPIPTPWGIGQFRPAVVVPAVFAIVSGPLVGGIGAALGTFLGSFILALFGLSNPLLSLMAGVPANFVSFYVFGWLVARRRTWPSFITATFITLILGNLIAAAGVMFYFTLVVPRWVALPIEVKLATIFGFTLFWVVTMLPFIMALVPPLVGSVSRLPGHSIIHAQDIRLEWAKPSDLIYPSLGVALILGLIYCIIIATPLGSSIFALVIRPEYTFWAKILFFMAATFMVLFGTGAALILSKQTNKGNRYRPLKSARA